MALSYPLALTDWQDKLRISEWRMELREPLQQARLADGTTIRASLGEPLWQGECRLTVDTHAEAAAMEALVALAIRPGASVLLYDPRVPGPAEDRDGSTLGGASVTLQAVSNDSRELALAGLPSGYVLSPGDMLAFTYGSNPTRYALHKVVVGDTADGLGQTAMMEVVPSVRGGATTGASVALVKPVMKALVTEADFGRGRATVTEGARLSFVQTFR